MNLGGTLSHPLYPAGRVSPGKGRACSAGGGGAVGWQLVPGNRSGAFSSLRLCCQLGQLCHCEQNQSPEPRRWLPRAQPPWRGCAVWTPALWCPGQEKLNEALKSQPQDWVASQGDRLLKRKNFPTGPCSGERPVLGGAFAALAGLMSQRAFKPHPESSEPVLVRD